jgi:catechol 2,3-dioxygenase-like lactoylglutathione lyase family enzyme
LARSAAVAPILEENIPMRIRRLDHLVLTVLDMKRTIDFYTRVLGMEEVTYGAGRKALRFGEQKINLHPADRPIDPNVLHATPGSADICLILEGSLKSAMEELGALGVPIIEGPVKCTGATGLIASIYIRDPDENLIELSSYELTS